MIVRQDKYSPLAKRREASLRRFGSLRALLLASSALASLSAPVQPAQAGDGTWLATPADGNFNDAANWNPAAVPNATAIFGASSTTTIAFSQNTTLDAIQLDNGAGDYSFSNGNFVLRFSGAGINVRGGSVTLNNSGVGGQLLFRGSSTAATATISNTGQLTFDQTSSAGASNITNNGSIHFNDGATAGAAAILNKSSIAFNNAASAGIASITNQARSSISFNSTSEAGNATIVSAGTLGFASSSSAANATITNNGTLAFSESASAGNATIANNSRLTFGDNGTAGSATITNLGTMTFANTSKAGTARINNPDLNHHIDFFDASSADRSTISGEVLFHNSSTAANAAIASTNNVNFSDNATAANATIASSGSVFFLDSSSGGAARVVLNNGTLNIASLATTGTTVGSIEGSGKVELGDKALTVGGNNLSTTFAGVINASALGSGGSLIKQGSGTLTLSGLNNYFGPTLVNGGTLAVDGAIDQSKVTVNAGGTLAGSGTVGETSIAGGTLAPGSGPDGIGTLTVQSKAPANLSFTAASTYLVRVSPAQASRTNVTGTATLGGAAVTASFAPGSYVARQYTILNAVDGVSGTFGALTNTNLPKSFRSSLSYDANNVYLDLKLGLPDFGNNLSANQRNVANALVNSFNTAGGIPLVFGALTPAGLSRISGETATGTQQATFDAMGMFMGVMTDPALEGRGGPAGPSSRMQYAGNDDASRNRIGDAYAAIAHKAPPANLYSPRWSVWAAGFGGSQTTSGNTALGSNDTRGSLFGVAAGADYYFSPKTVAGFALAGGGSSFSVANGGSGRSDLFQLGGFIRHTEGAAFVTAALAYGWQDVTTDRSLNLAGVDQLRARFNANALSGRLEGGYRFGSNGFGFTPYAAGQFTTYMLPSYAEQAVSGTNQFALAYGARDVTAARSELGLRTERTFAMTDSWLTLRSRLAWAHDFNQDRSISASFQALPASSFVVNGARQAADSALTSASAEIAWRSGWSAIATFEGQFSNTTESYAGKGTLRYTW